MGKILVLAEKPSVGRDIAKVLKCNINGRSYLEGSKYIVTWALGHLVTLADPEVYDDKYKKWSIETLPMLPNKMKLVVISQTAKQFGEIKKLMNRNDIDELVIATDPAREGELVARWIIEKVGFRKPIKRLWISSQTERAIIDGFNKLRPSKEYDNLYMAAVCRAEADWLIGLNITRALTCKYNAQLSAGRVQTPTLSMIVKREGEIKQFIPKDYWTISGNCELGTSGNFSVLWHDNNGQTRLFSREKAEEIVSSVKGGKGKIIEIKKEAKKEMPPLAYDLTELQRDANRMFGYSAKQTLNLMQSLYENHKLLTYPRTDSRYITDDMVPTLPERLRSVAVGPYAEMARFILKGKIQTSRRLVDNNKVTEHSAIIPTEETVRLGNLNNEERHIYDLVVKRFFAVLLPPFEYEETTVKININSEVFSAKGKIVKLKGWKAVYDMQATSEEDDEGEHNNQALPEMHNGDSIRLLNVRAINGKTKPPARFTEATLLTAMENPGKLIDDEKLREAIDSTSGLGTPATRADIIEKLFNSFYVERKGKEIFPTSKGTQIVELVPDEIRSPELTAKWEQQLALVSKGKVDPYKFIQDMKMHAAALVKEVTSSSEIYKHDNVTREKCPECGKYLLEVNGKRGKMLVCQDRECGYRKGISQTSNARCPVCHKKMEIRGDGENKIFICSCGYREKLSAFKNRRDAEGTKLDKKEVARFLNKQNNDEPINNALAEALAKFKNS